MKVSELIKRLQELPPDAECVIYDSYENEYLPIKGAWQDKSEGTEEVWFSVTES